MPGRINPTILDKLMSAPPSPARRAEPDAVPELEASRTVLRDDFANLDAYTEEALQANVRRELAWLLNATNLESVIDLTRYADVKTSVLNYGVADLTGKAQSRTAVAVRAARIREAVVAFEPRLDPNHLAVEVSPKSERENAITFTITGDITSAVQTIRVQYKTDIEIDTGAVEVRE